LRWRPRTEPSSVSPASFALDGALGLVALDGFD
jgi:hypothetical protein